MRQSGGADAGVFRELGAGVDAGREPAAFAQSQTPAGAVRELQGAVTVTRGSGTPQTLTRGAAIFPNDILETGANAKLLVGFSDGTAPTLGPNADVVVDDFVYNPGGGKIARRCASPRAPCAWWQARSNASAAPKPSP